MKNFMDDQDFLLSTKTGEELFHNFAEGMPIVDYHCHISPKEIWDDKRFENITEVWLGGDHYKWRLMRANGVDERFITAMPLLARSSRSGPRPGAAAWATPSLSGATWSLSVTLATRAS